MSDQPERALWVAVIHQAFVDANFVGREQKPIAHKATAINRANIRSTARAWLLDNGPNFRTVCSLAGLDPDFVRRHAARLEQGAGDVFGDLAATGARSIARHFSELEISE